MLSRRENLLIRPWQERRYRNHRRKVISATPAIDARPPPFWGHVCCKLKSSAKEEERTSRIEQDNFRLLQRMGKIMRSSKKMVDDRWKTAQPTFLNRVGIYVPAGKTRKTVEYSDEPTDSQETACPTISTTPRRHARCLACCPGEKIPREVIPEERIPWEPAKASINRRKSSPVRLRSCKDCPEGRWHPETIKREEIMRLKTKVCYSRNSYGTRKMGSIINDVQKDACREKNSLRENGLQRIQSISENLPAEQIVLSCGSLTLSLTYPPESSIQIKNIKRDSFIPRGYCYCNAYNLRNTENRKS